MSNTMSFRPGVDGAFMKDLVDRGRYASAAEVMRAGLRLLKDAEELHELKMQKLRADIQEGFESGNAGGLDFADIRRKARDRAGIESIGDTGTGDD